jgi:hypothetical protein
LLRCRGSAPSCPSFSSCTGPLPNLWKREELRSARPAGCTTTQLCCGDAFQAESDDHVCAVPCAWLHSRRCDRFDSVAVHADLANWLERCTCEGLSSACQLARARWVLVRRKILRMDIELERRFDFSRSASECDMQNTREGPIRGWERGNGVRHRTKDGEDSRRAVGRGSCRAPRAAAPLASSPGGRRRGERNARRG